MGAERLAGSIECGENPQAGVRPDDAEASDKVLQGSRQDGQPGRLKKIKIKIIVLKLKYSLKKVFVTNINEKYINC